MAVSAIRKEETTDKMYDSPSRKFGIGGTVSWRDKNPPPGVTYSKRLRQWIVQPQAKPPTTDAAAKATSYEMISLYRSSKSGNFIVQPMTRHPLGCSGEFGGPTAISNDQFDACIVPIVIENLGKYHEQVYQEDLAPKRSAKEYRKFVKEHLHVSVTRFPSGQIDISPSHHERGGYVGDKESISLRPDEIPWRLAPALREAFSKSS